MRDRLSRIGSRKRYLILIFCLGFVLMVFGIWVREPHVMGPDEKSAITKALWLGVHRTPFIPDFTKGGKLYIYLLAVSFAPFYVYLKATGRTDLLAEQATRTSTFFEAPEALKDTFYDFLLIGRFVSVLIGVLTLYLVYRFVRIQFDERRALLASGILAIGMGFVNMAHLATEDMLLTGLLTLTFVLFAEYDRSGNDRFLWAASITSGLAVSAKMTAGFLVFPLIYFTTRSHVNALLEGDLLAAWEAGFRTGRSGVLALSAYLLTTPAIFVYPDLYVTELLNESAAAFAQSPGSYPGWLLQPMNLARVFGLPLFLATIAGVGLGVRRLIRGAGTGVERSLWLFIVPYFAVVGSWQTSEVWYVTVLMPFFAMYAAEAISWSQKRFSRRLVRPIAAAVLLFSVVYTGITVHQMTTDARVDSAEWIEANVESAATIDIHQYPLHLPDFPERVQVNRYWFNTSSDENFRTAKSRVRCAIPEYVVLASNQYGEFLRSPNADPAATSFYRRLLHERLNYEVAATFGPPISQSSSLRHELWLTINPKTVTNRELRIVILERKNALDVSCPDSSRESS